MGGRNSTPDESVSIVDMIKENYSVQKIKNKICTLNINQKYGDEEYSILHICIQYNRSELISFFINSGCAVNSRDEFGQTPLHFAAKSGDISSVKSLVENLADINMVDLFEYTALHYAVMYENVEVTSYLVGKVENINCVDNTGESVLDKCVAQNSTELCHILIVHGAKPVSRDSITGRTALHRACMKGNLWIVQLILGCMYSRKATFSDFVNAKDKINEDTALHVAVREGFGKAVKLLIKCKAETSIKNKNDQTALELAETLSNKDIINNFLDIKKPVNLFVSVFISLIAGFKRFKSSNNNNEDENYCTICYERLSNCILICHHRLCSVCCKQIESCPYCRRKPFYPVTFANSLFIED